LRSRRAYLRLDLRADVRADLVVVRLADVRVDFLADVRLERRRAGTFLPLRRASESPMAIACLRLFTVLPLRPVFSVPFLRRRIALLTVFEAAREYFAMSLSFAGGVACRNG
jgi:hypothetical protein